MIILLLIIIIRIIMIIIVLIIITIKIIILVIINQGELDGLLGEINGACTYQNMVNMFQEKMAGGSRKRERANFMSLKFMNR